MPETKPPVTHVCTGCNRHFTQAKDLAPARVGREDHRYCRPCYTSAMGVNYPTSFEQAQQLERAS